MLVAVRLKPRFENKMAEKCLWEVAIAQAWKLKCKLQDTEGLTMSNYVWFLMRKYKF